MLVIRLDIDKSKENYRAVVEALSDFDIASTTWETDAPASEIKVQSGRTGGDLSSAISAAVSALERRSGR